MSWLWLWHVGFDFFLSCGGWVCVCVRGRTNVSGVLQSVQGMAFWG